MKDAKADQRGFSLIVAMMVVVLLTLLVVGAIAFTGSERSAAVLHTRGERLTGCTEAARDLVLGRVRALSTGVPSSGVSLNMGGMLAGTAHYAGSVNNVTVSSISASQFSSPNTNRDMSNTMGDPGSVTGGGYYNVVASCSELADGGGATQEVEFVVKVSL